MSYLYVIVFEGGVAKAKSKWKQRCFIGIPKIFPFASAYKDVFAFTVIIIIMAWRPTGLIAERSSERV